MLCFFVILAKNLGVRRCPEVFSQTGGGLLESQDIWEFQGTRGLMNWHVLGQGNPLRGRNQSLESQEEVSMGPSVDGPVED
ncbi:hypothetical protein NQ315_002543 [Exocentrus adspersus]|uniref:Uncharacterized protein n=1 Tax=Exocentrus adspersus TaxID=1586481 RepID=A0AAV8VFV3_9CUCU|nr:hypothetical protein NQ315_002543 [Exocentrus adspersus]